MEIIEANYHSIHIKSITSALIEGYKKNDMIYIPRGSNIEGLIKIPNNNNLSFIKIIWKMTYNNSIVLEESCTKIVTNEKYIKKKGIQIDMIHLYHHKRIQHNVEFKKLLYGKSESESIDIMDKKDKFGNQNYYIDCNNLAINDLVGDPYPNIQKKLFIEYETSSIFETVVYIKRNKLRKDLVIGIDLNNYKLNMISHIVPIKCQAFGINMSYLSMIQNTFNNKKILSIIEGVGIEDRKYLENWIKLSDFDCIYKKNNKDLGEAVSIRDLIKTIKSNDKNEYTFYFHSKGVSKKNTNDPFVGVWIELMFKYCISNIDSMIYNDRHVGGAIRSFNQFHDKSVPYHFTGTFFWFSHKVFDTTKVEDQIKDNYYSVEMLSGKLCPLIKSQYFLKDHSMAMYRGSEPHHRDDIKNNMDLLEHNLSKSIIVHLK